jgi:hypothetical protein
MRKPSIPCTLFALATALGLSACHKNTATNAASSAASASASAPSASAAASASAAPAATESAAPNAPPMDKAKAEINGKSMSDAELSDIDAALKKFHWKVTSSGATSMGATETITVHAKKGHLKADISLVRPSGAAETGSAVKMAAAKEQEADFAKKGATLLDGDALLAVVIKRKKKVAKKLLEELTEK